MIDLISFMVRWPLDHWDHLKVLLQAFFCGGIAFLITFKYQRNGATYYLVPSLCAFGIASLTAQQWLSLVGNILIYGEWQKVSIYNTLFFAMIFILLHRAKGNVSRMFEICNSKKMAGRALSLENNE